MKKTITISITMTLILVLTTANISFSNNFEVCGDKDIPRKLRSISIDTYDLNKLPSLSNNA